MTDFINSSLLKNSTVFNNFTQANIQDFSLLDLLTRQNILDFIQIATLIFLILYVVKTWEIASATREAARISEKTLVEMKETREQENAPYIIVFCEIPIPYDTMIYLIVKNIGKSPAEDVKIEFNPKLSSSLEYTDNFDINNLTFLREGIKFIPPGYEIRTLLDNANNYFSEIFDFPFIYEVKISYVNSISRIKIENFQTIDLLAVKQLKYIKKYSINDLVKEVKIISEEMKKLGNK